MHYMYNGHRDVVALINEAGQIEATYYYDAFGNIEEETGNKNNKILYRGYEYDKETGLYYLNARHYDPRVARFMQEDTYTGDINDPLSLNLYTYCANNPIRYIDPSGHAFTEWDDKYVTRQEDRLAIEEATIAWIEANKRGDEAGKRLAHASAEAARNKYRGKEFAGRPDGTTYRVGANEKKSTDKVSSGPSNGGASTGGVNGRLKLIPKDGDITTITATNGKVFKAKYQKYGDKLVAIPEDLEGYYHANATKLQTEEAATIVIGFTPLDPAKDLMDLVTGKDVFTGDKTNRGFLLFMLLLPEIGEQVVKQGVKYSDEAVDLAKNVGKGVKGGLKTTLDYVKDVEKINGKYFAPKNVIDEIGKIEAKGIDFSDFTKKAISTRKSTEGGFSTVYNYSDSSGVKFVIHEVTDALGNILHRDFDAVRIDSGQLINKLPK
jgi:RHS repeat-associated protein